MKKSYLKILIIELTLFLVLLFNSFFKNILSNYYIVLFMVLALIIFKINFNFEKDKHQNSSNVMKSILIYLIIVLVIYYIIGFFSGFAYNNNYYTFKSFTTFILPTALVIILSEFLRYQLLQKSEGNILLVIFTTILLITVDVTNTIYYADFDSVYNILVFVGLYLLPSIARNLCKTYICLNAGYKPSLLLGLVLGVYSYLLPIVPNFSEYMKSIFDLLVPIILFTILLREFKDVLNEEVMTRSNNKINIISYALLFGLVVVLTYFTSGYFKYTAVAIASGSMSPTFDRGAVVIIKKIDKDYDKIKVGDIVAYEYENKVIVHRVVKVLDIDGEHYFYTKGDANASQDGYKITEDMIKGIVNVQIPFIGYPTVMLSEL